MTAEETFMKRNTFPSIKELDKKVFFTDHITVSMLQEAYWHGYFPWPEDSLSTKIPVVSGVLRKDSSASR